MKFDWPDREKSEVNNREATRSSVAMRTDLSAELPKIVVDRVQLQQMFMNLMLNAIEAMKDSGGELTVKSHSVSDAGPGLPAGKVDQIFSAFFTIKFQGSGMGLAISHSIVESHGGRLWATPTRKEGNFSFHLTNSCDGVSIDHIKMFMRPDATTSLIPKSRLNHAPH